MLNTLHGIDALAEKTAQNIAQKKDARIYGTNQTIFKRDGVRGKSPDSTEYHPSEKTPSTLVGVPCCPRGVEEGSLYGPLSHQPSRVGDSCHNSCNQIYRCKGCIYCCALEGVNKSAGEDGDDESLPLPKSCNQGRFVPLTCGAPVMGLPSQGRSGRARTASPRRSCVNICTSYYRRGSSKRQRYRQGCSLTSSRFAKILKSREEATLSFSSSCPDQHLRRAETFWISTKKPNYVEGCKVGENFFLKPSVIKTDEVEERYEEKHSSSQTIDFDSKGCLHTLSRMPSPEKLTSGNSMEGTRGMNTERSSYVDAIKSEDLNDKERDDFCSPDPLPTANTPIEGVKDPADAWGFNFSVPQDGLASSVRGFISGFWPSAVPFRLVSNSLSAASSRLVLASMSAASFVSSPTSFLDIQTIIRFYLDTSGRNSRNDPNVVKILESVFQLLVFFQANHPILKGRIFNLLYLGEVGRRHQQQYELYTQDLHEASILSSCQLFAYGCDELVSDKDNEEKHDVGKEAFNNDRGLTTLGLPAAEDASVSPTMNDNNQRVPLFEALPWKKGAPPKVYHSAIQQIHDILRFAIAVYGAPYHTGSLSSLFGVAMIFTIHKEKVESLPKAVNDCAVTDILSLPSSALKLSRWSSRATEISYVVLVEHLRRRIVVSFRGTMTDGDILTDICALGESFCGGLAHQGVARAVNAIFNQRTSTRCTRKTMLPLEHEVKAHRPSYGKIKGETCIRDSPDGDIDSTFLHINDNSDSSMANNNGTKHGPSLPQLEESDTTDDLLDTLERLVCTFPSYKIIITGHSLGGGVAVLFAIRLSYEKFFPPDVLRRIHVISFAPMPTLTLPAAALFDEGQEYYAFPIWNIVNGCDIVPRLQVNSLHRLLGDICKVGEDSAGGLGPPTDSIMPGIREGASSDVPDTERAEGYPTHELYHPGKVFLMTSPWDPSKSRFVEVPRGHKSMHEIFLMKSMLNTHMLDNYMEGLVNLRPSSRSSTK
ncbi:unnamed protein product [Phytomonas sp. EM1]|nr:unnamed protein product [Phytomonas sp. EM1]|eukprot:CCW63632.1 unnamed protein product [Phytomonas sp. isolate EM1]